MYGVSMTVTTLKPQDVLAETEWLRRLALSLVRDEDRAEDLAQDVCVTALERPPRRAESLRPWLRTVMQNRMRQRAREQRHRRERERQAARAEAQPATADLVERVSVQRRVAGAVLALREPYRGVLLLRYFEDLSPREISRRQGTPITTVYSHIHRGLKLLREQLADVHGGSREALRKELGVLMSVPVHGLSTIATGALIMKTKLIGLIALPILAAGIIFYARSDGIEDTTPAVVDGSADPAPLQAAPGRDADGSAAAEQLTRQPIVAVSKPATLGSPPPTPLFRGRVIDAGGRPVADLPLKLSDGSASVRADGAGGFEIPLPAQSSMVVCDDRRFATILAGVVNPNEAVENIEPIVVIAPAIDVSGHVVGEQGQGMEGAEVSYFLPVDFYSSLGFDPGDTKQVRTPDLTDGEGAFAWASVGAVPGAGVSVRHAGYLPTTVDLPMHSVTDLELVLERAEAGEGMIQGQILTAMGVPAGGAFVALGRSATRADKNGIFTLSVESRVGSIELTSLLRGHLPGSLELSETQVAPDNEDPVFVYLNLGPRPFEISGRVLRPDGAPARGARVWVRDTQGMMVGNEPAGVEAYLAGGFDRDEAMARSKAAPPPSPEEENLGVDPSMVWGWVATDSDGRFRLKGMLPGPYVLRSMPADGSSIVETEAIPAGSAGVEIRLREDAVFDRVSGVVVDASGQPVPDVIVGTRYLPALVTAHFGNGTRTRSGEVFSGEKTRTDEGGRFELLGVGKVASSLTLSSDAIVASSYPADIMEFSLASGPTTNLRVVVSRRLRVRLELAEVGEAEFMRVFDGDGAPVEIHVFGDGRHLVKDYLPIHEGKTQVFVVEERAAKLQLVKLDRVNRVPIEVRSIDLVLLPDEVNVIRD